MEGLWVSTRGLRQHNHAKAAQSNLVDHIICIYMLGYIQNLGISGHCRDLASDFELSESLSEAILLP
jgi:retron-type reverse transcriptase